MALQDTNMPGFTVMLQFICLILIFVLSLCVWRRYFSDLNNIPGPFFASFTRLWHINRILKGDQNLELIRLHDKHGHFVRIAPSEISTSHPDAPRIILLDSLRKGDWYKIVHFPDKRFKNASKMRSIPFLRFSFHAYDKVILRQKMLSLTQFLTVGETDPAKKNELSRHLASGYLLSNLLKSEPAIDSTIELLIQWLDKYSEEHKLIHLDQFFTYTAFDIIGETIFSQPFGFLREGKDIGGAIANSLNQNIYVAVGGYIQWLHFLLANPFTTWLNILPFGHIIDTAMGAIKEREKNPDVRFDAVQHWFRYLAQHPDRMDHREIQSAASNAVAAGADTVACGLQAFVYHMIRRPDFWERARMEVEQQSGLKNRVVSYADTKTMPFLQACIKESLRIFSPAPMGLPRLVGKGGTSIGGHNFPEGTTISVSTWVIHQSTEIWGPDAREFQPERWLQGEESSALEKYFMPVSRLPCLFSLFSSSLMSSNSLALVTCPVQGRISLGSSLIKFVRLLCAILTFTKLIRSSSGNGERISLWHRTLGRATLKSDISLRDKSSLSADVLYTLPRSRLLVS